VVGRMYARCAIRAAAVYVLGGGVLLIGVDECGRQMRVRCCQVREVREGAAFRFGNEEGRNQTQHLTRSLSTGCSFSLSPVPRYVS